MPDKIGVEDCRSVQDAEHQRVALAVSLGKLASNPVDLLVKLLFGNHQLEESPANADSITHRNLYRLRLRCQGLLAVLVLRFSAQVHASVLLARLPCRWAGWLALQEPAVLQRWLAAWLPLLCPVAPRHQRYPFWPLLPACWPGPLPPQPSFWMPLLLAVWPLLQPLPPKAPPWAWNLALAGWQPAEPACRAPGGLVWRAVAPALLAGWQAGVRGFLLGQVPAAAASLNRAVSAAAAVAALAAAYLMAAVAAWVAVAAIAGRFVAGLVVGAVAAIAGRLAAVAVSAALSAAWAAVAALAAGVPLLPKSLAVAAVAWAAAVACVRVVPLAAVVALLPKLLAVAVVVAADVALAAGGGKAVWAVAACQPVVAWTVVAAVAVGWVAAFLSLPFVAASFVGVVASGSVGKFLSLSLVAVSAAVLIAAVRPTAVVAWRVGLAVLVAGRAVVSAVAGPRLVVGNLALPVVAVAVGNFLLAAPVAVAVSVRWNSAARWVAAGKGLAWLAPVGGGAG